MRPIITPVVTRNHRCARSIRPGSPTIRVARRTTSTTGKTTWKTADTRNADGISSYSAPTTRTASAMGNRRSARRPPPPVRLSPCTAPSATMFARDRLTGRLMRRHDTIPGPEATPDITRWVRRCYAGHCLRVIPRDQAAAVWGARQGSNLSPSDQAGVAGTPFGQETTGLRTQTDPTNYSGGYDLARGAPPSEAAGRQRSAHRGLPRAAAPAPGRGQPTARPDTERRWTSDRDRVRDEVCLERPGSLTLRTVVDGGGHP